VIHRMTLIRIAKKDSLLSIPFSFSLLSKR
jgi:hypothetical protein